MTGEIAKIGGPFAVWCLDLGFPENPSVNDGNLSKDASFPLVNDIMAWYLRRQLEYSEASCSLIEGSHTSFKFFRNCACLEPPNSILSLMYNFWGR
jgi:hypothetical protein